MTTRRTACAQPVLGEAEEHMALHNLACVEPRRERSGYAQQISVEALKTGVEKRVERMEMTVLNEQSSMRTEGFSQVDEKRNGD
jgi:hypothetical protein